MKEYGNNANQNRNNMTRQIIGYHIEKIRKDNILANQPVFIWVVSK